MMNLKKKQLKKFVVDIKNSNKMWIKADKSRNLYKTDSSLYKKILHNREI